jgi:signal transduction histidine kinase
MPELNELAAVWPLGASLATAVAVSGLRTGRRRIVLNEAVHEVRRPLQVLALTPPSAIEREPAAIQGSVEMAAIALERLEREINGEPLGLRREVSPARPLLDAVVGRWRGRAVRAGGSLALSWRAGTAAVEVDRAAVAQALDNLVANALEHGGAEITIEAATEAGRLRVAVLDSGGREGRVSRRRHARELFARLGGRRRRGHGLRLVRRTASAHGGRFRLGPSGAGTEAVLELPLAGREAG